MRIDELKKAVDEFIGRHGAGKEFNYQTAYELPLFYAFTNCVIKNLGDLKEALNSIPDNELSILFNAEAAEAANSLSKKNGFVPDAFLRKIGSALVDSRIPGIAILIGSADDCDSVVRQLQEKNLLILLAGNIVEQLEAKNVKTGAERNIVPLGKDLASSIHAVNLAVRIGLAFGNIGRGDKDAMMKYLSEKLPVFVLALGKADENGKELLKALKMLNISILTDQPDLADLAVYESDYAKLIQKAIETKGIKANAEKIDIPVAYSMAFEGERIRKPDVYVEAGGGKSPGFELVRTAAPDKIENGKVQVVGQEIDQLAEGSMIPIGIFVELFGRHMREEFESVIERKIHDFLNYAEGVMHVAQRNFVWLRISKDAFRKGLRLRHIGEILVKRILSDFSGIVDKVQVTIFTDREKTEQKLKSALNEYAKRDSRLKGMTDESVDKFYTCLLCQSFAPNHICVITPERSGLCGGINWLDAQTSHEINPAGPNQPIEKGECSDPRLGIWKSVDNAVVKYTHEKIKGFCMYSIMQNPCTSCGCFECIVAIMPECNGVVAVDREFDGLTPLGMKFTTLAGEVGGGNQLPGFLGVSKLFLLSRKFLQSEGGIKRVVWMPSKLKEYVKNNIDYEITGIGRDFFDKVADETTASGLTQVVEYLKQKNHPVISMDPLQESSAEPAGQKTNADTDANLFDLQSMSAAQRIVGAEIIDGEIDTESIGSFDVNDKIRWARQAVEKGAQILYLRLDSINPNDKNKPASDVIDLVKKIQDSINVPLIVVGCGEHDKDREVFELIAPLLKNGFIGNADEKNYRTYAGISIANRTGVVAFSNIDFNIAKQLNTLLRESGVSTNRIIMDPLTGALGYGLEYTYSVIERIKLAAASGDIILNRPIMFNAAKSWSAKESKEFGAVWEKTAAIAGICSGANIIIARHPDTIEYISKKIREF